MPPGDHPLDARVRRRMLRTPCRGSQARRESTTVGDLREQRGDPARRSRPRVGASIRGYHLSHHRARAGTAGNSTSLSPPDVRQRLWRGSNGTLTEMQPAGDPPSGVGSIRRVADGRGHAGRSLLAGLDPWSHPDLPEWRPACLSRDLNGRGHRQGRGRHLLPTTAGDPRRDRRHRSTDDRVGHRIRRARCRMLRGDRSRRARRVVLFARRPAAELPTRFGDPRLDVVRSDIRPENSL